MRGVWGNVVEGGSMEGVKMGEDAGLGVMIVRW